MTHVNLGRMILKHKRMENLLENTSKIVKKILLNLKKNGLLAIWLIPFMQTLALLGGG